MTKTNGWKVASVLLIWAATAGAAQCQMFTTLVDFNGTDGYGPSFMALVQGADGYAYGTTDQDGGCTENSGCGTIFKVSPEGILTILYTFCPLQHDCADGANPDGGLILALDGNFYGTTSGGGLYNRGTIFRISSSGMLTTLHSFCAQPNCADGSEPVGALTQALDGNIYGTTPYGGTGSPGCNGVSCGTIFRITPFGVFAMIHSFNCLTDGCQSFGGLIQAADGYLYGTASGGGTGNIGGGTVFRVSTSGKLMTLYNFCGQTNCADGAEPTAGVVQGIDGNFYGTIYWGGSNDRGTAFKLTAQGTLTTLYSFCEESHCADGSGPQAGLVQATDGNFYGTAALGGANNSGTVFGMSPQGSLKTLHRFDGTDGRNPEGALLQGTNGSLYGATSGGGNTGYSLGTVFRRHIGLSPFVAFVSAYGKVGQTGGILGQGFKGTTRVSLNGTPVSFKVISDTFIRATVPAGATTGYVTVTTPSGTLTSNVPFHVIP